MSVYLGLDFGTSGARAIAIDAQGQIQAQVSHRYSNASSLNLAADWQQVLEDLLTQIPVTVRQLIQAIAIDGTSSSVLLCNAMGQPLTDPLLYNDDRGRSYLDELAAIAPANHVVLSATSSLAKLAWWSHQGALDRDCYLLHQADWLACLLHGKLGISDYHNCLKLGYDVEQLCYPEWLSQSPWSPHLPRQVLAPGTPIGPVLPDVADRLQLQPDCSVCAGTTDSIAAFLASGVTHPGEAVTSLGSTLVLKLWSHNRIEDSRYGIYSHRFGKHWLVGGASNTGGAVLSQFFSASELLSLSAQIQPDRPSSLDYYPLLCPGERFPINDPHLLPRLEPQPDDRVEFLQGLLESMARIEAQGYQLLQDLGATPLTQVYTAGGGAMNETWTQIRARYLGVPVRRSPQTEAAYGAALLAMRSCQN